MAKGLKVVRSASNFAFFTSSYSEVGICHWRSSMLTLTKDRSNYSLVFMPQKLEVSLPTIDDNEECFPAMVGNHFPT